MHEPAMKIKLAAILAAALLMPACGMDSEPVLIEARPGVVAQAEATPSATSDPFAWDLLAQWEPHAPSFQPLDAAVAHNDSPNGIPIELLNRVAEALYSNNIEAFLGQMDDPALSVKLDEVTIAPRAFYPDGSGIEALEKSFNEGLPYGKWGYLAYRFDGDGDGEDELYLLENLLNSNAGTIWLYTLEPDGTGRYLYARQESFRGDRFMSAFAWEGSFYFVANVDGFLGGSFQSARIARFKPQTSNADMRFGFLDGSIETATLTLDSQGVRHALIYETPEHPLAGQVKACIEDTLGDLMDCDSRDYGIFYGQEALARQPEHPYIAFSADVDNDGVDELFTKGFYGMETALQPRWYNKLLGVFDASQAYAPGVVRDHPLGYELRQLWFVPFEGQTVTFRLLRKTGENRYLLDACLWEGGRGTHLAVYGITHITAVSTEQSAGGDKARDETAISHPYQDALASMLEPCYDAHYNSTETARMTGYGSEHFPRQLVDLVQKGLLDSDLWQRLEAFAGDVRELTTAEFLDALAAQGAEGIWYLEDEYDYFKRAHTQSFFEFDLDGDGVKEYLAFTGDGSGGFAEFDIYQRREEGWVDISERDFLLGAPCKVIRYEGTYYFVLITYDYNSKLIDGATLFHFFPDGTDIELHISFPVDCYDVWPFYSQAHQSLAEIEAYMEEIAQAAAFAHERADTALIYGDEALVTQPEVRSRLWSASSTTDFYEVDYNNDGQPEYYNKHLVYPSVRHLTLVLEAWFYRLGESVQSFTPDFVESNSYQLWFKSFGGKTFTFSVAPYGTCYTFICRLIEADMAYPICGYLLVPQIAAQVTEVDEPEFKG